MDKCEGRSQTQPDERANGHNPKIRFLALPTLSLKHPNQHYCYAENRLIEIHRPSGPGMMSAPQRSPRIPAEPILQPRARVHMLVMLQCHYTPNEGKEPMACPS